MAGEGNAKHGSMSAGSARYRSIAVTVAVVLILAALGGMAFAGWLEHGARIFVALAASGLALCM